MARGGTEMAVVVDGTMSGREPPGDSLSFTISRPMISLPKGSRVTNPVMGTGSMAVRIVTSLGRGRFGPPAGAVRTARVPAGSGYCQQQQQPSSMLGPCACGMASRRSPWANARPRPFKPLSEARGAGWRHPPMGKTPSRQQ